LCRAPRAPAGRLPAPMDEYAQTAIREPVAGLIDLLPDEAAHFACHAVVLKHDTILPEGAPKLAATLHDRGYRCHELPMSEFLKAGGACKCLTMFLPQRENVA